MISSDQSGEGGEEGAGQPPVVGDLSEGVRGEECEVVTQVAPRPDAGALVEQITYLTSWPQTTPPVSWPRPLAIHANSLTYIMYYICVENNSHIVCMCIIMRWSRNRSAS